MKEFTVLLKKVVFSKTMLITIIIGVILLFFPIYPDIFAAFNFYERRPDFLYYINIMHIVGVFDLFAPVLASLPCSSIYYDDLYRKTIFYILPRSGRYKYIAIRISVCSVAGGLAILIPTVALTIISLIFGKPHLQSGGTVLLDNTCMSGIEFAGGGFLITVILLMLAFIFGAVWAVIGMTLSAFIESKYTSYAGPFMIYFGSSMLLAQSEKSLTFSPINMLFPDYHNIPSLLFCFAYQITLYIFSISLFYIKSNRRLKNDL